MEKVIRAASLATGLRTLPRAGAMASAAHAIEAAQAATRIETRGPVDSSSRSDSLEGSIALADAPAPASPADPELLVRMRMDAEEAAMVAAAEEKRRTEQIAALKTQLEVASAQLEELRNTGKEELDSVYAEARRQGHQAGLAQGEREGRAALRQEVENVGAIVRMLEQARRQVLEDAEDELVELVFAVVCRILGEQGVTHAAIGQQVRTRIEAGRDRATVTVRLHPDDASLLKSDAAFEHLRIVADGAVALGGCIVDSSTGSLDARFETQLARLADVLRETRTGRGTTTESA